jgi:Uma2 family endonuclease
MEPPTTERFRPLRRIEYDKLVELGAFQHEHLELLEGLLVPMSPIGPPHSSAVMILDALFQHLLFGRASVRAQMPFAALDFSEPEPDIAVVPLGRYDTAHPDQAHLIIEVAETSLPTDRGIKLRLYASCGVPEYWIVNLSERVIEVHSDPSNGVYAKMTRYEHVQSVRPIRFPDIDVRVSDIIP